MLTVSQQRLDHKIKMADKKEDFEIEHRKNLVNSVESVSKPKEEPKKPSKKKVK